MANDPEGGSERDWIPLAREYLRKHGRLTFGLRKHSETDGEFLRVTLLITFHRASPQTVQRCIEIMSRFPKPPFVYTGFIRRPFVTIKGKRYPLRNSWSRWVTLAWTSMWAIEAIAEAIGWHTGKESLDTKLKMLKQWIQYRRVAGAYDEEKHPVPTRA